VATRLHEDARVSVKPFFANMQCAAVSLLISFAFVNPLKHEMITLEKPGAEIEENACSNWMNFDRQSLRLWS
jgi:hypothetical protein